MRDPKYKIGEPVTIDPSILEVGMTVTIKTEDEALKEYPKKTSDSWKIDEILIVDSMFVKEVTIDKFHHRDKSSFFDYEQDLIYPSKLIKNIKEYPMIKTGDVVECISSNNENKKSGEGAYKKGHYYLVSKVTEDGTGISTALDSNGIVGNGWGSEKFKRIASYRVINFDNLNYMCIKDVDDIFTAGKTYQCIDRDGYLTTDKKNRILISNKYRNHFLDIQVSKNNNDWDKELPGTSQENDDDDWELPDEKSEKEDIPESEEDINWDVDEKEEELPPVELRDVDVKQEIKDMFPFPVLLEGSVGTGKTTIFLELAKELGLKYYASTLTDQTSASEFKGYKNAMNGEFVRTEFRECYEHGGLYILEEINAATSNMPIIFNSIDNGYFVFADKIIYAHPDFRLGATMNTITNAKDFGGRRILDKSVRNRFHRILVEGDIESRYKTISIAYMNEVNKWLEESGVTDKVTPRDMQRFEHMVANSSVDTEIAIRKCMINDKIIVSDEHLRKLVKTGQSW